MSLWQQRHQLVITGGNFSGVRGAEQAHAHARIESVDKLRQTFEDWRLLISQTDRRVSTETVELWQQPRCQRPHCLANSSYA